MKVLTRLLCILLLLFIFTEQALGYHAYYPAQNFKKYPYKKKQKNERKIRSIRNNCENEDGPCSGLYGLDSLNCIRRCMSEDCFEEIYSPDPIEEGEIDTRYNSFKGCILQKH